MGLCKTQGFLSYNEKSLIPDGVIDEKKVKIIFNINENTLKNPQSGVSYELREDGNYNEIRKQLPSDSLFIEFFYRTRHQSNLSSVGSGSNLGGGLLGGGIISSIANSIVVPTATSLESKFIYQLGDEDFSINVPIKITQEILDNPIDNLLKINIGKNVVSVLGVYEEKIELSNEELKNIGNAERRGIMGTTNTDGQVEGLKILEDRPDLVENNIFKKVYYKDDYHYLFRGDNQEVSPDSGFHPFDSASINDFSSTEILINNKDFSDGDEVYATLLLKTNDISRHLIKHKANFINAAPAPGVSEFINIGNTVDGWNYKYYSYKTKLGNKITNFQTYGSEDIEIRSSWRLFDVYNSEHFYILDRRGISIYNNGNVEVIFPAEKIKDQDWFNKYLEDNDITDHDLIIDNFGKRNLVFDISEHSNSLLYDRNKLPFHKMFAEALQNVSKFTDKENEGIGICQLDMFRHKSNYSNFVFESRNEVENYFDLSLSEFQLDKKIGSYSVTSDCALGGTGSYYDPSEPSNTTNFSIPFSPASVLTEWLMRTPVHFNSFSKTTRVFVERFFSPGGDKNSYIFVRTYVKDSNMSLSRKFDYSNYKTYFYNGNTLAYHNFKDIISLKDTNRKSKINNNFEETIDLEKNNIGVNRLIGNAPSYQNGYQVLFNNDNIKEKINKNIDFSYDNDNIHFTFEDKEYLINKINVIFKIDKNNEIISKSFSVLIDDKIINNYYKPLEFDNNLYFDISHYEGTSIYIKSDVFKNVSNISEINLHLSKKEDLKAIPESSFDTFMDELNNDYIITDSDNMNIYSNKDGKWKEYKNILYLLNSDNVSNFQISKTFNREDSFDLFYVLNDKYLMCKRIYVSDIIFDQKYENDLSDFDKYESIKDIEYERKKILSSETFFVECINDDFVKSSIDEERYHIKKNNDFIIDENYKNEIDSSVLYKIIVDGYGNYLLFYIIGDKIHFKISPSYSGIWKYIGNIDINNFHKTNKNDTEEYDISNFNMYYDEMSHNIYIVYYIKSVMYMRIFNNNDFYYDISDEEENNIKRLFINKNKKSIVLTGDLTLSLSNLDYLENNYSNEELESYINVLDTSVKPEILKENKGYLRIFYKTTVGTIASIYDRFFVDSRDDIDNNHPFHDIYLENND